MQTLEQTKYQNDNTSQEFLNSNRAIESLDREIREFEAALENSVSIEN